MAGYLDQYGAGDERRAKIIKRIVVSVVAALLVVGVGLLVFHNYSQQRQVKRFLNLLAARDYKGAYALWGCTDARPCRDYPFPAFMEDWGPQAIPPGDFVVLDGESCGSGVMVDVGIGKTGDKKLWVERSTGVLGFPPFEICPQRNRIADWLRGVKYRLHGRIFRQP